MKNEVRVQKEGNVDDDGGGGGGGGEEEDNCSPQQRVLKPISQSLRNKRDPFLPILSSSPYHLISEANITYVVITVF